MTVASSTHLKKTWTEKCFRDAEMFCGGIMHQFCKWVEWRCPALLKVKGPPYNVKVLGRTLKPLKFFVQTYLIYKNALLGNLFLVEWRHRSSLPPFHCKCTLHLQQKEKRVINVTNPIQYVCCIVGYTFFAHHIGDLGCTVCLYNWSKNKQEALATKVLRWEDLRCWGGRFEALENGVTHH